MSWLAAQARQERTRRTQRTGESLPLLTGTAGRWQLRLQPYCRLMVLKSAALRAPPTMLMMMASFSRPWKPSTVLISSRPASASGRSSRRRVTCQRWAGAVLQAGRSGPQPGSQPRAPLVAQVDSRAAQQCRHSRRAQEGYAMEAPVRSAARQKTDSPVRQAPHLRVVGRDDADVRGRHARRHQPPHVLHHHPGLAVVPLPGRNQTGEAVFSPFECWEAQEAQQVQGAWASCKTCISCGRAVQPETRSVAALHPPQAGLADWQACAGH